MNKPRSFGLGVLLCLVAAMPSAAQSSPPCGVKSTVSTIPADLGNFGHGLTKVPRAVVNRKNLKWEIPFVAATGFLIGHGDRVAADRIQSTNMQDAAKKASNIGLTVELGSSAAAWMIGCATHHPYAAESGFKALEAAGVGLGMDLILKAAFNRQYPYTTKSSGEFWEGGKSFPSGHTVTSFAFASAMAHRYPHVWWIKWGSYALATTVSISRYPAKKHFPSDILVGIPVGFFIGKYMVEHDRSTD
jgi:hypothetical protein